jgi:hypothetical protein
MYRYRSFLLATVILTAAGVAIAHDLGMGMGIPEVRGLKGTPPVTSGCLLISGTTTNCLLINGTTTNALLIK